MSEVGKSRVLDGSQQLAVRGDNGRAQLLRESQKQCIVDDRMCFEGDLYCTRHEILRGVQRDRFTGYEITRCHLTATLVSNTSGRDLCSLKRESHGRPG